MKENFTEYKRVLAVAEAANVPVTLSHEELAVLLDALEEQEGELIDLERRLKKAEEAVEVFEDKPFFNWMARGIIYFHKKRNRCLTEQLAAARQWITELERRVD